MNKREEGLEVLDVLVEHLKSLPPSGPRILVPVRLVQFWAAYRAMEAVAHAIGGTIFFELRENEGWGSFTVEAAELIWDRSFPLPAELMLASNLEVYPLANGKLRLSTMFYGLTKTI